MADYHALITEMADELDHNRQCLLDDRRLTHPLADRARALLAEPEAEGPTDEALNELFTEIDQGGKALSWRAYARAVLARWGHPAATPVPVSERLPAAGEWVWHCYAEVRFWEHGRYNGRQFFIGDGPESQPATHWLPANALPLPAPEGGEPPQ